MKTPTDEQKKQTLQELLDSRNTAHEIIRFTGNTAQVWKPGTANDTIQFWTCKLQKGTVRPDREDTRSYKWEMQYKTFVKPLQEIMEHDRLQGTHYTPKDSDIYKN